MDVVFIFLLGLDLHFAGGNVLMHHMDHAMPQILIRQVHNTGPNFDLIF